MDQTPSVMCDVNALSSHSAFQTLCTHGHQPRCRWTARQLGPGAFRQRLLQGRGKCVFNCLNTYMHLTIRVVACAEQANSAAAGAEGLARSASGSFEKAAKGGPGAVLGREGPETMWRRPDNPPKPLRCVLRSAAPCKLQAQTVRSPGSVIEPGSEAELACRWLACDGSKA